MKLIKIIRIFFLLLPLNAYSQETWTFPIDSNLVFNRTDTLKASRKWKKFVRAKTPYIIKYYNDDTLKMIRGLLSNKIRHYDYFFNTYNNILLIYYLNGKVSMVSKEYFINKVDSNFIYLNRDTLNVGGFYTKINGKYQGVYFFNIYDYKYNYLINIYKAYYKNNKLDSLWKREDYVNNRADWIDGYSRAYYIKGKRIAYIEVNLRGEIIKKRIKRQKWIQKARFKNKEEIINYLYNS